MTTDSTTNEPKKLTKRTRMRRGIREDLDASIAAVKAKVTADYIDGVLTRITFGGAIGSTTGGNVTLQTTSSALNGTPSCQVTFFLSFQVVDSPSGAIPPLARVGISAARTGTGTPSAS